MVAKAKTEEFRAEATKGAEALADGKRTLENMLADLKLTNLYSRADDARQCTAQHKGQSYGFRHIRRGF